MLDILLNILAWIAITLGSIVLVIFALIFIFIIWAAISCVIGVLKELIFK